MVHNLSIGLVDLPDWTRILERPKTLPRLRELTIYNESWGNEDSLRPFAVMLAKRYKRPEPGLARIHCLCIVDEDKERSYTRIVERLKRCLQPQAKVWVQRIPRGSMRL